MEPIILKKEEVQFPDTQTNSTKNQNRLASLFCHAIKSYPYTHMIFLKNRGEKEAGKFFKSKSECREGLNSVITKAYHEANSYFSTDSSKSVAKEAASFYAGFITNGAAPLYQKLEPISDLTFAFPEAFRQLKTLIDKAHSNLLRQFQEELRDNNDYYQMYDLNYFIEQVDIEEHDYNLDTGDKIFDYIARLVSNNMEYTLEGLFESINELEDDLNKNAFTFFSTAFELYQEYCRQIVQIAETLGNKLTDEDLAMLEILPPDTTEIQY